MSIFIPVTGLTDDDPIHGAVRRLGDFAEAPKIFEEEIKQLLRYSVLVSMLAKHLAPALFAHMIRSSM